MSLKGRFVHNTIPNGIVRKFQFLQFRSNKGEEVSTSQRLSNPSNRGIGFQCQEKSRATYSLPRRGGGDRNEKTVCNTRYQPRNCRGAERERERDQDRRDRPRARKTVQDKVLLFFLAAKPFFPSFFPRLLPIPLSEFMRNLMARGKDKDLSLRDE